MPPKPRISESEVFQIVLLGSFNPAIFHPQWFAKFNLIGSEDAGNEAVKVVSPEFTDINIGPLHLQCVANKFTIETGNIAFQEKLRDLMEGLLSLLPHTPIKGCGLNSAAHYRMESEAYWHKIGHTLAPKEPVWTELFPEPPLPGLTSLGIKGGREGHFPGPINVIVAPSVVLTPGLFISVNHHHDVPADITSAESAQHVRTFIHEMWGKASEHAKVVGRVIFDKITPDYERSSS